ncbi:MAG: ThiF family adenylyltransferase [Candidatus Hodarchaeales archaeon]|jgi:molybdopterin/thiamine biosynthesis adenylyltransferase
MSSDSSVRKYDRQQRLSIWNQQIIENSTIMIVGVGGTGGEVSKNLALLGIGKLILVDTDTIEYSNLNRQLLFTESDVGKYKVDAATKAIINRYNNSIQISKYNQLIEDLPHKTFEKVDILAGCVDNFQARQYLNEIALEFDIPLIDSATDGYFGQIQSVNVESYGCLACDSPPPPDETQTISAPCTLVGTPRTKEHCAWKALYEFHSKHNREPQETSDEDIAEILKIANKIAEKNQFNLFDKYELLQVILFHVPSLVTVNAVTSGIQSQEIIKVLFRKKIQAFTKDERKQFKSLIKSHRFRIPSLTIYSALAGNTNIFDLVRDPNCLICGKNSVYNQKPVTVKVNPKLNNRSIFNSLKKRFKKEYIGFRGDKLIQMDDSIEKTVFDGDRITVTSLTSDKEFRVRIKYTD